MPSEFTWRLRWRRIGIAVIALVLAVLLLGNLALNLPPLKPWLVRKIEGGVGKFGFGGETKVGLVTYTPWGGATLRNVRIGDPATPMFRADLRARFSLLKALGALLGGGDLEIAEVICDHPEILLPIPEGNAEMPVQNGAGVLAAASPTPEAAAKPDPKPDPVGDPKVGGGETAATAPATKPTPPEAQPEPPEAQEPAESRSIAIGRMVVDGGEIVIVDRPGGREIIRVDSFEFEFEPSEEEGVLFAGEARTGAVAFIGHEIAAGGTAQVKVKPAGIEISEVELPVEGGVVRGVAKVENQWGQPFRAEFRAEGIALADLLAESRGLDLPFEFLAGKLGCVLRFEGWAAAPGQTRGRAKVVARGLEFSGGGGVRSDGLATGSAPGSIAGDAAVTFDLLNGNLFITTADFKSGALWIRAVGRVEREGQLDVVARLYTGADFHAGFERAAAQRATGGAQSLRFQWLPGTDWHFHDFRVGGHVKNPIADFWRDGSLQSLSELFETLTTPPAEVAMAIPE